MQDLKAIRFIEGTKVSHDYEGNDITTFSYRDLWERGVPAIGIPCKQNGLLVVDVDVLGESHKKDGTEFWAKFCAENNIPQTYTVKTPSGGYHYYFKLPEAIDPDLFHPPGRLSDGVDLKWNGWVGAPPTAGYSVEYGVLASIQYIPDALLDYISNMIKGKPNAPFKSGDMVSLELATPFTPQQLALLDTQIAWIQQNASLSRDEWRDGIFALKAGIPDPEVLDDYVVRWTINKSYVEGDEEEARAIAAKADRYGGIKPGTILALIKNIKLRSGVVEVEDNPFTLQQILDKSQVNYALNKEGKLVIEQSESNVAALIGAFFPEDKLYHDLRNDQYVFKGKPSSEVDIVNMILPMLQNSNTGLGLDKFRKPTVVNGLDVLMATRKKDPHQEFLKNAQWDGVKRIEKFFIDYAGVEDSEYTRIVSKNFWVSLAARGLNPGCKIDSMVVLEGHEGIRKSSLVEAIGGEYTYAPSDKDVLNNLDCIRQMHQAIIVELPELMGLINESPEKVKAFLSKSFDTIRNLFAKKAIKKDRGFIFVGTTNSDQYLAASMGVRRFWPIRIPSHVKEINIAGVKRDREQLFAEAIAMYRDGYPYWNMPQGTLEKVVSKRFVEEPLSDVIKEMIPTLGFRWSIQDIYKRLELGGFIPKGLTMQVVKRIDTALKAIGCYKNADGIWSPPVPQEPIKMLDELL